MDTLSVEALTFLIAALGVAAVLYATSGHGGATAYLALFGLWSLAPAQMKPLALVMNVVVAGVGVVRLSAVGAMPWRTIGPLLLGSIPCAWLGGLVTLPATTYRALLGACLLAAALRLWLPTSVDDERPRTGRVWAWPLVGAGLGFLSGLTGIGGGIFLSPLLVLGRFEDPKRAAAASALFIVVNSLSGLLAQAQTGGLAHLPRALPLVLVVVFVGGFVGSFLAAHRLAPIGLRRALGVVLVVSGVKLFSEAL